MWLPFAMGACPGGAYIEPVEKEPPDPPVPTSTATTAESDTGPIFGPDFGCGAGLRPYGNRPLARWPYLQSVTTDSATVVWGSDDPKATGTLAWGPGEDTPNTLDAVPTDIEGLRLLSATLTGLQPDTEYCYGVSVDGVPRMTGLKLRTAPATSDEPVTFVAFGDMGAGTQAQLDIRDRIAEHLDDIDLWLTTGDNAYSVGRYDELQTKVFEVYADLWHRAPVYPTPGNHDYGTDNAQPYLDNFFLPRNALRKADAERYYSIDWGPIHYVALDSQGAIGEATPKATDDMFDWLDADLAATDRPWKVVAWHHPPYEGHPTRPPDLRSRLGLVPLMEKHDVQLVLLGHNHYYERTKPIRADQEAADGVTYVITGAGGQYLYPVEAWELQEVGIEAYNFVMGHADDCTLTVEAIDEQGKQLDSFELTRCQGSTSPR